MTDQPAKSSTKTFNLTIEESGNLDARTSVLRQLDYQMNLVLQDIQNYKDFVICKRLGIEGKNYSVSRDNKVLTLVGGENDIKTK